MICSLLKHYLSCHGRTFLTFLTVGAISAIVNFSSFSLFWGLFKINYQTSISISYIFSVIFHFTANRRFTFNSKHENIKSQIPRYLVMVAVNYCITLLTMYYVVSIMKLSPYLGTVSAIGMTVGTGYLMAKFWVFSSNKLDIIPGG